MVGQAISSARMLSSALILFPVTKNDRAPQPSKTARSAGRVLIW
jgi:hypothetical protein